MGGISTLPETSVNDEFRFSLWFAVLRILCSELLHPSVSSLESTLSQQVFLGKYIWWNMASIAFLL